MFINFTRIGKKYILKLTVYVNYNEFDPESALRKRKNHEPQSQANFHLSTAGLTTWQMIGLLWN